MNDTGKGDHDVDQPRRGGERPAVKVGGGRPRACYALLDGVHEDPESGGQERVTISTGDPSEADYLRESGYPWHRTDHNTTFAPN